MKNHPSNLKLGKRSRFVKTHLGRLDQGGDLWEADFRPAVWEGRAIWQGLVVTLDGVRELAAQAVERPPTVGDMADLLAGAMLRPADQVPRRPMKLRLRKRREWEALLPHLRRLGIVTVSAPRLARWDRVFDHFCRKVLRPGSEPRQPGIEELYPAIARGVRDIGWIEIGDQEGFGFVARALDYGGLVFEDRRPRSLGDALATLERGLAEQLARE